MTDIGHHDDAYLSTPLEEKLAWFQNAAGLSAVEPARQFMAGAATLYTDSDAQVRATLRNLGVDWTGEAATNAGATLQRAADWSQGAGNDNAAAGQTVEGYGQSFESLRGQVHYDDPWAWGWNDTASAVASVATANPGIFLGNLTTDYFTTAQENRTNDAAAVAALRAHEEQTRAAVGSFPAIAPAGLSPSTDVGVTPGGSPPVSSLPPAAVGPAASGIGAAVGAAGGAIAAGLGGAAAELAGRPGVSAAGGVGPGGGAAGLGSSGGGGGSALLPGAAIGAAGGASLADRGAAVAGAGVGGLGGAAGARPGAPGGGAATQLGQGALEPDPSGSSSTGRGAPGPAVGGGARVAGGEGVLGRLPGGDGVFGRPPGGAADVGGGALGGTGGEGALGRLPGTAGGAGVVGGDGGLGRLPGGEGGGGRLPGEVSGNGAGPRLGPGAGLGGGAFGSPDPGSGRVPTSGDTSGWRELVSRGPAESGVISRGPTAGAEFAQRLPTGSTITAAPAGAAAERTGMPFLGGMGVGGGAHASEHRTTFWVRSAEPFDVPLPAHGDGVLHGGDA